MTQVRMSVPPVGAVRVALPAVLKAATVSHCIATRDHALIRAWAARHRAEPATGEATASGPATIDVNDGSVGIRFNFPGVARFRPIDWDEWFAHLEQHHLVFVHEEETADRAYARWQARGGGHGLDREDWIQAERELRQSGGAPIGRYWFVQKADDAA